MRRKEVVKRAVHFRRPPRVPYAGSLNTDVFPVMPLLPESFQPTDLPPHVDGGSHAYKQWWYRRLMYRWDEAARKQAGAPKRWWHHKHASVDEWGVVWQGAGTKDAEDHTMGHPRLGPLQGEDGWDRLDDFAQAVPDATDPSRYRFARSRKARLFSRRWYCTGTCGSDFFFTRLHMLRGFNQFLVDLRRRPKQVRRLVDLVLPFYLDTIRCLHEAAPWLDCFSAADDWGSQHGAFVSPELFREFFYEPYRRIIGLVHDLGMDFFLHSCGDVSALLPLFVELGVDQVEFDSPHMTGLETCAPYAERQELFFWCCVDIQKVWPFATPAEVEGEVKRMIDTLGSRDGGFGAYEYFGASKVLRVPPANVRAMRRAAKKWGRYRDDGRLAW
ncbi:MAG: hypothetical protein Kow0069_07650 [Promethearchaeota archaeon]